MDGHGYNPGEAGLVFLAMTAGSCLGVAGYVL